MSSFYDLSHSDSYKHSENATSSPTNEVAYRLLGHLAFQHVAQHFNTSSELRVADVGCYTGGTTIRWLYTGRSLCKTHLVKVLGFDIHASLIAQARENYPNRSHLSFVLKRPDEPLPLIDDQPYHLIFAPFVVETIPTFDEVTHLYSQLIGGLVQGGELYFLRLHPNALTYQGVFRDYGLTSKPTWAHGDLFDVRLADHTNLIDRFWSPDIIASWFEARGCSVEMIPIQWAAESAVEELLRTFIEATHLDQGMPEWSVPLYQIIRVVKQE